MSFTLQNYDQVKDLVLKIEEHFNKIAANLHSATGRREQFAPPFGFRGIFAHEEDCGFPDWLLSLSHDSSVFE